MAQVEILSERDAASCWMFSMQVLDDAGALHQHELRLSWADYNLWSADGADSPAKVAEAAMQFLLAHHAPADIPDSFDASLVRRMVADADQHIPSYIRQT